MHCPNCGQPISAELKFCRSCGLRLDYIVNVVQNYRAAQQGYVPPTKAKKTGRPINSYLIGGIVFFVAGLFISLVGNQSSGAVVVGFLLAIIGVGSLISSLFSDETVDDETGLTDATLTKEIPTATGELKLPSADDSDAVASPHDFKTERISTPGPVGLKTASEESAISVRSSVTEGTTELLSVANDASLRPGSITDPTSDLDI